MSGPDSRVAVATAQRDGSRGPSQDRIRTTANAVIVLDGASQPEESERDGGWIADQIGAELAARLVDDDRRDLPDALHDAIAAVAARFELVPGEAPSTTVSVVRWTDDTVDVLVLGDTPVIVYTRDGAVHEVRDDRLAHIDAPVDMDTPGTFGFDQPDQWHDLVAIERAARNKPGGYWIAEATPEAAHQAVRAQWPRRSVAAVLVLTDGVADGVDVYGTPPDWPTALQLATPDPQVLVDLVHETEQGDLDGVRWPRTKRHDDKAAALVRFYAAPRAP